MNWFKKKIIVPETNETREEETVQLWSVRWMGRNGSYHADTFPTMEAFTSEEKAKEFATSLENAFRLVRNSSSETRVKVSKMD